MGWKWELYTKARDYSGYNWIQDYWRARSQPDAVFIWIPKSAGTSVHAAIGARKRKTLRSIRFGFCQRGIVTFSHIAYAQLLESRLVSESFNSRAFKFAIVRDPYDRAVSLYVYLRDKAGIVPVSWSFLDLMRHLVDKGISPIGLYNTFGLSQCNPQVRWIEGIEMDYIGRFESISRDLASVGNRLGLSIEKMPHQNATIRQEAKVYFCSESKEIVEHIYEEDFQAFGYHKW